MICHTERGPGFSINNTISDFLNLKMPMGQSDTRYIGLELKGESNAYLEMISREALAEPITINKIIVMMVMIAMTKIIFFEYLLYVRYYDKYFTFIM